MTRKFSLVTSAAIFALILSACSGESQEAAPPTELTGGEAPQEETRSIDWASAKQARIQAIEEGKNSGMVSVQSTGALSPVPVLLPSGIVMPQNATPMFQTSSDGYFAHYQTAKYDIVVNGTNAVYDGGGEELTDEERSKMVFTPYEAGAQVAFSRFGADYLVEFDCRILDGEENCISQTEAMDVIEGLFVAATSEE